MSSHGSPSADAGVWVRGDDILVLVENAERRMIDDPNGNWSAFLPEQLRALVERSAAGEGEARLGDPKERLIDQMTGSQQFFSRLTKAEADRDAARAEADELRDTLRVCHQHTDWDMGYSAGRRDERAEHRDDLELLRKQRDELRRERDELKAAVVELAPVPVSDEAEAAWDEYNADVGHDMETNPMGFTLAYRAFLAGFLAARGKEA